MPHSNRELIKLMDAIDLGSSVAELDNLLETARVETSVFNDLFLDNVDLVPGNKGSGKSALYRIFVEFLDEFLLENHKVVIAHGVNHHGDSVFLAFNDEFKKLDENDFVNFWCIYFISLISEQFIKSPAYNTFLKDCDSEISAFLDSCQQAYIPEIKAKKGLRDILGWTLATLSKISPKLRYKLPNELGELELDLLGRVNDPKEIVDSDIASKLPRYAEKIKMSIEAILVKTNLHLWLMVDRLDEIFPRRSELERKALRGLLRTMRIFSFGRIKIKVFLRDDILNEVVKGGEGFTALTHITAHQADTLRWSEDNILAMIVNRLFASNELCEYLEVDQDRLRASSSYKYEAFYKVFPPTVHKGTNQSNTLRWIYTHTADGNNVVTPRDVIDLLTKAKQYQQSMFKSDSSAQSEWIIGPQAIQYGHEELSKRKRSTFLEAEFPHLWDYMSKFVGGKTEYTSAAMNNLFGKKWQSVVSDLISIGFISKKKSRSEYIYKIPFLYRKGLEVTQGRTY